VGQPSDFVSGPSSNVAFTRHISSAVARVSHISQPDGTQESLQLESGVVSLSRPSSPSGRAAARRDGFRNDGVNIYSLPPEAETLDLIRQYFSDTGLLFPYLHEETFLDTYAEMKRNNFTKIRRTWLGLLNMVLALVMSTTICSEFSAQKRAAMSDVYYQRAVGLCDKQIMRGTSLEVGERCFPH